MSPAYLSLRKVEKYVPLATLLGVSRVARSAGGFLPTYRRAGGKPARLSDHWLRRRDGFVKRHMAQLRAHGEPLFKDGLPTRRHLALIMWAYSPAATRI